jgi:hypothetical protein
MSTIIGTGRPTFAGTVFRPFVERQTYLAFAYALLGLPLGTFYLVFLATGLSLGLGLLVTLAGFPILVLVLGSVRALAQLERTLAFSLLDAPMPRILPAVERHGIWRRLPALVRSGSTWRELAYLLIRFPTGVASFSVAVTIATVGVYYALVEPILVAAGQHGSDYGSWHVDSVGRALLFVIPGLALIVAAPSLIRLQGCLERSLASYFLARIPRSDFRRAIAHFLARGEADAFTLISDLELYFRPGPYLTPIKLEAQLLSLRDLGLIESVRHGSVDRYSLTDAGRAALV